MSSPDQTQLRIIILGDSGVGKTSLQQRYNGKDFKQRADVTICVDINTTDLWIGEKPVTLQIWDTAGQERFNSLTTSFYRDTDCCVFVYDVNVFETFDSLDKWHDEFIKHANPMTPEKFPFVLIGNKTDINNGNSRVVARETADQWCDSKENIAYFETSAKEKTNVDEAFLEITKKALSNERLIDFMHTYKSCITTTVEEEPSRCSC